MIDRALFIRIQAEEGREDELEAFLTEALDAVRKEEKTIDWFALKFGHGDFAIFDTFPDEGGRLAHLAGKVGRGLLVRPQLIDGLPKIEHAQVLAFK